MHCASVTTYQVLKQERTASYDYRYSFICQGTSTRKQRSDLFGLRVKAATCYYQSNYSKVGYRQPR